ncbi:hypothetical protein TRFO_17760 [Tritrichomonas foetus]|uniref:Exostosin GT47 domain-containing protein n=1 Tax=Tritrichomonas foetus TaxID=1144522 RepID=A0A1J4KRF7_9EUKA|nr:hypothetical protein TRFO_17760 [Tritrichomonas foetus]|eukprot:OHT12396.1 hypothetical protein TRFO_17760 [Tritrichomonas foetus]
MSEGEPTAKVLGQPSTSQIESGIANQKLLVNKMNPYLLIFCIPIIAFLLIYPPYFVPLDDYAILETPQVLTNHYYLFESKLPPIKIYAYNITEPDQKDVVTKMFGSNPPRADRMSSQSNEIIIRHSVQKSSFRHFDAETADIFYCPFYLSISAMMQRGSASRVFNRYYNELLRKAGPWRDRYDGIDHSVVQMSPAYQYRAPINSYLVGSIGLMATMSNIPFDIPPRDAWHYTQYFHGSNALIFNETENQRDTSVFFLGPLSSIHWRPHGSIVRRALIPHLKNITNSFSLIVEKHETSSASLEASMHEKMRNSEICLEPEWDSPTSRSLTDAVLSFCVPLVYSNEAMFPFEGIFIDYTKILLQRHSEAHETLNPSIMMMNDRKLAAMRRGLRQVGQLWSDNKNFEIVPNQAIWGWYWMQFIQNSIMVASKRHFPSLLVSAYQKDIESNG